MRIFRIANWVRVRSNSEVLVMFVTTYGASTARNSYEWHK